MVIVVPLAPVRLPSAVPVATAEAAKVLPAVPTAGTVNSAAPVSGVRRLAVTLPSSKGRFSSPPTPAAGK